MDRTVARIIPAQHVIEGGGFPVRRPFPTRDLDTVDPFLLLDEMGPVEWGPGQAVGLQGMYGRAYSSWSALPAAADEGFTFAEFQITGFLRFYL